jgi:hypothetical protein
MKDSSTTAGGLPFGELFSSPKHLRADLRLLRRAIRGGWTIPEASRRLLMERVVAVLNEPESVPEGVRTRATLAAAWVVLEADRTDLRGLLLELGHPLNDLRIHRARME